MAQLKELTVNGMTTLVGGSTALTMPSSRNDDTIATTRFVKNAFAHQDALRYVGTIDPVRDSHNGGTMTPAASTGETYKVSSSGYVDGMKVTIGALLICREDTEAADSPEFMTNGSASYDENQHYYLRFDKPQNRIIGRDGDQYYYEELINDKVVFYVPSSQTLTNATNTTSCFYVKQIVNDTLVNQYVAYNAAFTIDNGQDYIPVYINLTANNFAALKNNLTVYIVNENDTPADGRDYIDIALNWDFISSDVEGILYKSNADFLDQHPLIADGTEGFVATSNYVLGDACARTVATGYNASQQEEYLVPYGLLHFITDDVYENTANIGALSSKISEEKEPIYTYTYTVFNPANYPGLTLTSETELNDIEYNGDRLVLYSDANGTVANGTYDSSATYYVAGGVTNTTYPARPAINFGAGYNSLDQNYTHGSSTSTIEDYIIDLYQRLNGAAFIGLPTDTGNAVTDASNAEINQGPGKNNLDYDKTQVGHEKEHFYYSGTDGSKTVIDVTEKLDALVGSDEVSVIEQSGLVHIGGTSGFASLISNVINLNSIVGIDQLKNSNNIVTGQLSNDSYINTYTATPTKRNLVAATEEALQKVSMLDWFHEGQNKSSLGIYQTASTYQFLTQAEDLEILNPNGELLTSFTSSRVLYNEPIHMYDNVSATTWKMEIRSNGNFCIKM